MDQGTVSKEQEAEERGALARISDSEMLRAEAPRSPCSLLSEDMGVLGGLLHETVSPHLHVAGAEDMRILNLACGRCDEADALVRFARSQTTGDVSLVGADIRIR